ncbi:MAG: hypothetical protein GXO28_06645 [Methanopyri archaeon]|nr:hypothetical protein [Methanopyri archaeon]
MRAIPSPEEVESATPFVLLPGAVYTAVPTAVMMRYHPMTLSDAITYALVYGMLAAFMTFVVPVLVSEPLGRDFGDLFRLFSIAVTASGVALALALVNPYAGGLAASLTCLGTFAYLCRSKLDLNPVKVVSTTFLAAVLVLMLFTSWMIIPGLSDNPLYALAIAFFVFIVGAKAGLGVGLGGFGAKKGITILLALSIILIPLTIGLSKLVVHFIGAALKVQRYALLGHAIIGVFLIFFGAFLVRKWLHGHEDVAKLGTLVVAIPCPICMTGVALSIALYSRIGVLNVTQSALVLWACMVSVSFISFTIARRVISVLNIEPAMALSTMENAVGTLFIVTGLIAWSVPLWKKAPAAKITLPGPGELFPVIATVMGTVILAGLWALREIRRGYVPPRNPMVIAIKAVMRWLA